MLSGFQNPEAINPGIAPWGEGTVTSSLLRAAKPRSDPEGPRRAVGGVRGQARSGALKAFCPTFPCGSATSASVNKKLRNMASENDPRRLERCDEAFHKAGLPAKQFRLSKARVSCLLPDTRAPEVSAGIRVVPSGRTDSHPDASFPRRAARAGAGGPQGPTSGYSPASPLALERDAGHEV